MNNRKFEFNPNANFEGNQLKESNKPEELEANTDALPAYLRMYEIPGEDSITERGFKRYLKNKAQDAEIANQIKNKGHSRQDKEYPSASSKEYPSALSIEYGLQDPDIKTQMKALNLIESIPEEKRPHLIELALKSENIDVVREAAHLILRIPETDSTNLRNILSQIIKENLENPNVEIQKAYLALIWCLTPDQIKDFIELGLASNNIEIQKIASTFIYTLGDSPEGINLQKRVNEKLESGLTSPDIKTQKVAASFIWAADKSFQITLKNLLYKQIKQGLENTNPTIQKAYLEMLNLLAEDEKEEIFNLALQKGFGEELIKPALYKGKKIDNTTFSRQQFEKTGSATTLIGGPLKDITIIRHITPEAFQTWQKLYENYNVWQETGFDYVPIEPIQSYKLSASNQVDVFSGVLDLSLEEWEGKTKMFRSELEDQKNKILGVLQQLGIKHGHAHESNFCLRFFRKQDGTIDFTKTPRLYLIDFDQAVS